MSQIYYATHHTNRRKHLQMRRIHPRRRIAKRSRDALIDPKKCDLIISNIHQRAGPSFIEPRIFFIEQRSIAIKVIQRFCRIDQERIRKYRLVAEVLAYTRKIDEGRYTESRKSGRVADPGV